MIHQRGLFFEHRGEDLNRQTSKVRTHLYYTVSRFNLSISTLLCIRVKEKSIDTRLKQIENNIFTSFIYIKILLKPKL